VEGVAVSGAGAFAWRDRPVLVTGATGLLGSWLVEELLRRGAAVTCLVRDRVPQSRFWSEGLWQQVNLVEGALEDFALVQRAINEYETDTLFHLAAQTIVGTASRSVLSTFESNIRGTWHVLEAVRQCGKLVKRVLLASSDKAYGVHDELPYAETAALQGRFPYDVSKSCADLLGLSYATTFGVPVAITRCGNLYGGGDLNWSRIVPGTIRSALRDERPVIRSDGSLVRDYFYVEDAALAYVTLAERLESKRLAGEAFNFGTGKPLSVLEIAKACLAACGKSELELDVRNESVHEIPAQYLDCGKAQARLGWEPRFTLAESLQRTAQWYRQRLA
jgi:CDP-glucose 4,6-dehydratase